MIGKFFLSLLFCLIGAVPTFAQSDSETASSSAPAGDSRSEYGGIRGVIDPNQGSQLKGEGEGDGFYKKESGGTVVTPRPDPINTVPSGARPQVTPFAPAPKSP